MKVSHLDGSKLLSVAAESQILVQRCVQGDRSAWRELHAHYYQTVSRFLRRLGVPTDDVEDQAQEVFVQVFRYVDRFEHKAEFKTWLFKLCIGQAGRYRRKARLFKIPTSWLGDSGKEPAQFPEFSEREAVAQIEKALSAMSEKHRTVFVLYELEGFDGKRIAEVTECPLPTIWRRLHHARKQFEDHIANHSLNSSARQARAKP